MAKAIPAGRLPNGLTLASLGLALMAALATSQRSPATALQYLALAAGADALAGRAARGKGSELGAELDSLATVLVWGVATALILHRHSLDSLGFWGHVLTALVAIAAAWRLCFGDIQKGAVRYRGLPPQAAGLVLLGALALGATPAWIAALILLVAALQLLPISYPRLPAKLILAAPFLLSLGLAALGLSWGWILPALAAVLFALLGWLIKSSK